MTAKQLCATGDKACKAELKRRGRDSSGKKIGSKAKKPATKDAASYKKAWAGFPRLAGGMRDSSLLEPKYGYNVYKGDLVYNDVDQAGATGWGVTVKKKGSKYTITGSVQEPHQGGDSYETLLSGASRAEAIRYLRGLKDYYGPPEDGDYYYDGR
jgi:hypothetical protein